eukprot:PITA_02028
MKVLRSDNNGDFCSKEFEEFCKKCGIARQKTTPYALEQNGDAERMDKTLMDRARSMLSGAELGEELWANAMGIACYLVNRSPLSAMEDKTPQEVWTGKKTSLSHLMVFGCDAYVNVPKERRTKLDSKSEKCIFIGEVKDVFKREVQPKEPEKIEFELKEEESDSAAEKELEDEEPQTLGVRRSVRERRQPERYSPSTFYSNFVLSITNDDPKTVKEVVDLEDGKLWKEAMVDEMASFHKKEA